MLQITRDFSPGHGHHLDARVAHLEQDRLGGDFPNNLGDAFEAMVLHSVL
jgi:hypothetical protein